MSQPCTTRTHNLVSYAGSEHFSSLLELYKSLEWIIIPQLLPTYSLKDILDGIHYVASEIYIYPELLSCLLRKIHRSHCAKLLLRIMISICWKNLDAQYPYCTSFVIIYPSLR